MRIFSKFFIVLAAFLLASCASRSDAESMPSNITEAGETVAANIADDNDPNELICRREQVTGTNFRRRVCLTRAQREEARTLTQQEMLQRQSATLEAGPTQ